MKIRLNTYWQKANVKPRSCAWSPNLFQFKLVDSYKFDLYGFWFPLRLYTKRFGQTMKLEETWERQKKLGIRA